MYNPFLHLFPVERFPHQKKKSIPPSPRTLKCYSCVLKRQMPPRVPLHKLHSKWQPQQVASQGRPALRAVLCNFPPFLISQRNAFWKEAQRWAAGGNWLSIRTFQVPRSESSADRLQCRHKKPRPNWGHHYNVWTGSDLLLEPNQLLFLIHLTHILRNLVCLASIKVFWVSLKASWTGRSSKGETGSQGISVTRKMEGGSCEWQSCSSSGS